jgi:hypothetical protein
MKRGIRSVVVAVAAVGALTTGPAVVAHAEQAAGHAVVAQQDDRENQNGDQNGDDNTANTAFHAPLSDAG